MEDACSISTTSTTSFRWWTEAALRRRDVRCASQVDVEPPKSGSSRPSLAFACSIARRGGLASPTPAASSIETPSPCSNRQSGRRRRFVPADRADRHGAIYGGRGDGRSLRCAIWSRTSSSGFQGEMSSVTRRIGPSILWARISMSRIPGPFGAPAGLHAGASVRWQRRLGFLFAGAAYLDAHGGLETPQDLAKAPVAFHDANRGCANVAAAPLKRRQGRGGSCLLRPTLE